ncbi:MAG TPA: PQQ-dependent sugar dehydrogenase, partial [Nitrososphaeraceae archaeon]|nr:PQQ-dependent sugar dehydrogenase [Nitrososphaeraceae archaeon]
MFKSSLFFAILLLTTLMIISSSSSSSKYLNHASAQKAKDVEGQQPIINDPNLKTEVVVNGLELPTGMAFLGPNDILVLEKNKGTVQRIIDGKILPEPLLDVNVANKSERGLLGIAVSKHENGPTYVFLYYTEAKVEGSDVCPKIGEPCTGDIPLGNRLYRYELVNNKLINPKLLLDLP